MTAITIREATPADTDAIVDGNIALAREIDSRILDRRTVELGVTAQLNEPDYGLYFVAQSGSHIIGQLALTWEWNDWSNGAFWWIQSVYIAPEFRDQGVFSQLYNFVSQQARAHKVVTGMRMYVNKDSDAAMEVYRRVGHKSEDLLEVDFTAP